MGGRRHCCLRARGAGFDLDALSRLDSELESPGMPKFRVLERDVLLSAKDYVRKKARDALARTAQYPDEHFSDLCDADHSADPC